VLYQKLCTVKQQLDCLENYFRTSLDCAFFKKNVITLKYFIRNGKQQLFDLLQKRSGVFKYKAFYQRVQKLGDTLYLLQTK